MDSYRKIRCLDVIDGVSYRLTNNSTGEAMVCGHIAPLLRKIAESFIKGPSDSLRGWTIQLNKRDPLEWPQPKILGNR